MDDRDCLLPMAGWTRNQVQEDPAALSKLGPLLKLRLRVGNAPDFDVLAVLSTASPNTRLCPALMRRIVSQDQFQNQSTGILTFHNGMQARIPLVSDPTLSSPHEVSIGLDLLQQMRLVLDFTTGNWEFHIPRAR
ncbi:hypothetical protein GE253_18515 [Niveispirillum sp. SYP-B3756]|uniref:hypothetical protein n=1 Tax=Niveispirillum sp. SYP-B3756 TaxID=2662178 RepID=UPI001291EC06|nr:hypothetical protein [Niveispirillum sp. SYP-B3756]MQP67323.1 hypothetical protein [Niveispirillum sp. SYP-B3756]